MTSLILLANSSPGVWYAYTNSDAVGKSIVVLLLVSSIFTWTVMIDKGMALWRARKYSDLFLERFRANRGSIVNLAREAVNAEGPIPAIYNEGMEKLLEFYDESSGGASSFAVAAAMRRDRPVHGGGAPAPVKLTGAQLNAIEAVLESEVSSQVMNLETRIGFLATMVSLSPFLGLFGTVWGVMMAFAGIAAAGKSDFTAIAPGVAGALLTTVAGLVVAIPSLVGYNLLTSTIRKLTVGMDNFTEAFMVKIKLEQLTVEETPEEPLN